MSLLCFSAAHAAGSKALPAPLRLTSGWELQDAGQVPQTGEALSRTDYQPAGWRRATVPGTVLTSLVNDGVYPEPLYGENNRTNNIPDSLCRTDYWYRTTFTPPQSYAGKQIWLNFLGINYIAEVWVNGRQVGTIKGAFTRGIFNVTPCVTVGAANALAVHVRPQPHPGATHEKTIASGTGPNGGVTGLDGPTFLCSIGWDWIPTIRDRDTGIWQDVILSATGPVVVQDPYVTSDLPLPRTDTADLTVQATVRNVTDTPQAGMLTGTIDGTSFKQDVSLAPNETPHGDVHSGDDPGAAPAPAQALVAQRLRAPEPLQAAPELLRQWHGLRRPGHDVWRPQDHLHVARLGEPGAVRQRRARHRQGRRLGHGRGDETHPAAAAGRPGPDAPASPTTP